MPTIAHQLGQTPHLSPLLHKVRKLGFSNPDDLRRLAVKRGCTHYRRPNDNLDNLTDPGKTTLSDLELAFAMLTASQDFDTYRLRTAVQLLSGANAVPEDVIKLARHERCGGLIRQVAQAALRMDDQRPTFWKAIFNGVQNLPAPPEGRFPHPSRYYLQSGILPSRQKKQPIWLRPTTNP